MGTMVEQEKLILIEKLKNYYNQKDKPILALHIVRSNISSVNKEVYECEVVEESNVEDIFKYILENRVDNPEIFFNLFEHISFGRIDNIINFFEKLNEEKLVPTNIEKIINFINVTNKNTILNSEFYSEYILFKILKKILPNNSIDKINELFPEVVRKLATDEITQDISYRFKIEKYLFTEKSGIKKPDFCNYYATINELIIPIKKLLNITIRNIHNFVIGAPHDDIELFFIGEDITKYKAFVEYLTINLHNYMIEDRNDNKEKHIEMFLLNFELEYKTKNKISINNEVKNKL